MPLSGYSRELRDLLKRKGRLYKAPKGQVIQSTEDQEVFNFVLEGYIKRYLISSDGSIGVQVLYGPGDFFPITLALKTFFGMTINESTEVYYYETMSEVEIYAIDQSALKTAVTKDPMLYKDLMSVAGVRLQSTFMGLENLTLRNSYKRVAHLLAYLAQRFGKRTSAGIEIKINLTHQDLADILSLTRETVSTSIIKLRKNGLIKTKKAILVPNLKKLQEESFS